MTTIRKARTVTGTTLTFRDAGVHDAEFIFGLRNDPVKSQHLSSVSALLEDQVAWLARYGTTEGQAYFIIEHGGERIGTVRLYDAQGDSFCWGSWILVDKRPRHAALESALMVYSYGVDDLGFQCSHFDVRKANEKVCRFHERLGATQTSSNDVDNFYTMSPDAIRRFLEQYPDVLSGPVRVER